MRFFSESMRGLGGRRLGCARRRGMVVGEIGVGGKRRGRGEKERVCLDCESRPGWARLAWGR